MRPRIVLALLFFTASAAAQLRPIYDHDDRVDPRWHDTPLFISRVVVGGARGLIDDYRPLNQDGGFLHFTNSLYWSHFQFDYKHSEVRAENVNPPERVRVCPCLPPVYFPPPPAPDAIPAAPLPSSKDTLQFAWYRPSSNMLRYRITVSRQDIDTVVTYLDTGHVAARLHGREESIGFDADTYLRIGGRYFFGSLLVARTRQTGTISNRSQSEFAYLSRFPSKAAGPLLLRALLTVGGVTGRGANGLNVINPAFEAFWHEATTDANFHLIWSPLTMRDGKGWTTHHQIAITVDRALFIHLFSPPAVAVHDLH